MLVQEYVLVKILWRSFCMVRRKNTMKKLLFFLLLTPAAFAQTKVFNVQHYCVDEKPFLKGGCDQSGNEYSFVFIDTQKKQVRFFLTDISLQYKIESSNRSADGNETAYQLISPQGTATMTINKQQTAISFLYPDKHIYLKVGASTKSQ